MVKPIVPADLLNAALPVDGDNEAPDPSATPSAPMAPPETKEALPEPSAPELPPETTPEPERAPKVRLVSAADLVSSPPLPPPGKGNRNLDDYRKLDWSKPIKELVKETGVTRQRLYQIKKELAESQDERLDQSQITLPAPDVEPPMAKAATDYKLLANSTFDMGTGLLTMTIGPEWQPRILKHGDVEINERDAVVDALQKYFEAKQVQDMPPGLMLTFIIASYAAPRFAADNTKTKFQRAYLWTKTKLANIFKRKRATITILPKENNENHASQS